MRGSFPNGAEMMRVATLLGCLLVAGCSFEAPAGIYDLSSEDRAQDMQSAARDQASDQRGVDGGEPGPDMRNVPDQAGDLPVVVDMDRADQRVNQDMMGDMAVGADMDPDMPSFAICEGVRRVISSDPEHCGGCDERCDEEYGECSSSRCGCTVSGWEACGAQNGCVDTSADPDHCGRCSFRCQSGEICLNSRCVCRQGLTSCNGECVDLETDPRYCGDCNTDCMSGGCQEGKCKDNCDLLTFNCNRQPGRSCIGGDEQRSAVHCNPSLSNSCGMQCAGDEFCMRGEGLDLGLRCRGYRLGRGCSECPCDDCGEDDCFERDEAPGVAYCRR